MNDADPTGVRRRLLRTAGAAAVIGLPALLLGGAARAQTALRPTPAQSEGPFYPVQLPEDADGDLLRNGALVYAQGQEAWVSGTVRDTGGAFVKGAVVDIWQCDHAGRYRHPGDGSRADPAFQGFGRITVGADGAFRFRTMRPSAYVGRTPHIHVKVWLGKRELLTTQLYVAGDSGNERDFLWRSLRNEADRAAITVPFVAEGTGAPLRAQFPIVVANA
jgi:protocatechuate 3,4-dioxygenase, beta subunit